MKRLSLLLFCCGALSAGSVVSLLAAQSPKSPQLRLVLAKDHVEGSFTTPQSVYADNHYVYLASQQGKLFILDKIKPDFPLVIALQVSSAPLMAVRGDLKNIYIAGADGKTYVYGNRNPFPLVATISNAGIITKSSIAVDTTPNGSLFVSSGQSSMAVDEHYVYLSTLNYREFALKESKSNLFFAPEQTFGQQFEPYITVVYDQNSGTRIRAVPNPLDINNNGFQQVALFAGDGLLVQTIAGCCGSGIYLYGAADTEFLGAIPWLYTNTVATTGRGRLLVAGTETGTVDLFDISDISSPVHLSGVNLRTATGHTGNEDIEIRSLWVDKNGKIYAGSSWGNDQSRGPTLPSFFVLRIR